MSGENPDAKRLRLAAALKAQGAQAAVVTMADSVCWLHNIRGQDLPHTPFALGFAILHDDATSELFLAAEKRSPELAAHLGEDVRLRDPAGYYMWMSRAANERRTFYGLLARRVLGMGVEFAADRETLSQADLDAVAATPEGLRALALIQIGQSGRADAELRLLAPAIKASPSFGRAVMLVAARAGLADLAGQLADFVQSEDGRPRDYTRFPIPRLRPEGGFSVDPALVYALARTESNFDSGMVSSAGARGLMQIMPETARFISAGDQRIQLHDPAVNLAVGQRYVGYLAGIEAVNGDLVRLLATYNSGPGGFGRWSGAVRDGGDPLLFIEAVPIDETRAFIPRVLTYTWIYAARMGMSAPSLDELAAGAWPRYHPVNTVQVVSQ